MEFSDKLLEAWRVELTEEGTAREVLTIPATTTGEYAFIAGALTMDGYDFTIFINWLATQPAREAGTYLAQRQAWVTALRAGESPFTPAVLESLRGQ